MEKMNYNAKEGLNRDLFCSGKVLLRFDWSSQEKSFIEFYYELLIYGKVWMGFVMEKLD